MNQASPSAYARYPSLAGVPVLITGGASGIGRSLVEAFAAQEAKVGFVDIQRAAGDTLAARLTEAGASVRFRPCDITDTPLLQASIRELAAELGEFLVLANNAADDTRHAWQDVTPEYWDQRVAVNLKSAFFAIQAVAPGMIAAGRGSVVNFGSVSWMFKDGNMPGYTSSKAAMQGLTRSFATSLGKHGIRVNTIVPGWVMTERQRALWVDAAAEARIDANQTLSGRRVQPEDIARMVLFLAAEDSAMCSAQNFIVDGGWV